MGAPAETPEKPRQSSGKAWKFSSLYVSPKMHQVVVESLGKRAIGFDFDAFYNRVALFYLEDCSYKDIASILDVPVGTVKSRIARGIVQLREILSPDGH